MKLTEYPLRLSEGIKFIIYYVQINTKFPIMDSEIGNF